MWICNCLYFVIHFFRFSSLFILLLIIQFKKAHRYTDLQNNSFSENQWSQLKKTRPWPSSGPWSSSEPGPGLPLAPGLPQSRALVFLSWSWSSRWAMEDRWTSSGPSAMRSVLAYIYLPASHTLHRVPSLTTASSGQHCSVSLWLNETQKTQDSLVQSPTGLCIASPITIASCSILS